MLMMICAKYRKNASRIVDFFQGERIPSENKVKAEKLEKLAKNWNFRILL